MRSTSIAALFSVAAAKSTVFSKSKTFLAADLQPEVVAHTLVKVEDEWRAQAASFAECNATLTAGSDLSSDCSSASNAFQKSCSTVVDAVVKASSGARSHVKEYMHIVCGESELSGWHQERCSELALSVYNTMSDDDYENRESFNVGSLCTGFWSRFTVEEKARIDQERVERDTAEKKAEEERVEAEKKAAELAAEEQKRREKEEQEAAVKAKKDEAEHQAEEAKRVAEEATVALKAKKEEAERLAEEARHKMEEAQAAADLAVKHHREVLANATAMAKAANVSVSTNATNVSVVTTAPVAKPVAKNVSVPRNVSTNATAVNASK